MSFLDETSRFYSVFNGCKNDAGPEVLQVGEVVFFMLAWLCTIHGCLKPAKLQPQQ
jgi:hypothetical protein